MQQMPSIEIGRGHPTVLPMQQTPSIRPSRSRLIAPPMRRMPSIRDDGQGDDINDA
jgi:hypothetical protein